MPFMFLLMHAAHLIYFMYDLCCNQVQWHEFILILCSRLGPIRCHIAAAFSDTIVTFSMHLCTAVAFEPLYEPPSVFLESPPHARTAQEFLTLAF